MKTLFSTVTDRKEKRPYMLTSTLIFWIERSTTTTITNGIGRTTGVNL